MQTIRYYWLVFFSIFTIIFVPLKAQVRYIQFLEKKCVGGDIGYYEWLHYPKNSFRIDIIKNLVLSENENNYIWAEASLVNDYWVAIPNIQPPIYQEKRQFRLLNVHYPKTITFPDTFSVLITQPIYGDQSLDISKLFKYNTDFEAGDYFYRNTSDMVEDTTVLLRIEYNSNQIKKQKIDSSAFLSYEYIGDADLTSAFTADKALAYWSYLPYLKWLFAPKKDGEYHFLLANAFLIKCEFKNNQLHNRFLVYSLDGCLVGEKKYKKGKLANAFLYFYTDTNTFQSGWEEWTAKESPIVDFQARNLLPALRKSMEKDQPTQLVFMDKIADSLISLDTVKKVFVYKPFQPLIDSLWDWDLDKKLSHFHSYRSEEADRNEEAENGEDD